MGPVVVGIGVGVVLLGLAIWSGALSWFGRLPGDIRIESGSSRVFVPITSMLVVSVVATIVVNVWARLR